MRVYVSSAVYVSLFLLGGCVGQVGSSARVVTGNSPISEFSLRVTSFEERRFETVVRQRYDFSCGSAALATLLRYHYNDPTNEEAAFIGMWRDGDREQIRKVGFSLLDMKRYMTARGLKADGYRVSLDQVAKTAIPGIALIAVRGYRHFVVVKGVSDHEVLVGDPSTGMQVISREEFAKTWNGVYFVINSDQDVGRASFGTDPQWARFARAPLGGRFLDPLSLQALALTAPFLRDF